MAATSPTTLLATLVSLDPIYLDFDISESDFQTFSRYRGAARRARLPNKVELALGHATTARSTRQGTLDFVDNVLDRSSGTIHARATVPNADLRPDARRVRARAARRRASGADAARPGRVGADPTSPDTSS